MIQKTVAEVMKEDFDVVDRMATINEALSSMRHHDTKCLIVEKRDDKDEYGMLLISDVARNVIGRDRSPDRVNVYEIMTKPVITVKPEMNIRYCARLFERFDLSRAPVVKDSKVIGIVSFTDMVMKGLCEEDGFCET